ncbi:MAG: hypothetical protein JST82_09425 [Bacteroidetes bacterium]|nr:hypothetical protein [Bacteroidota bacterium]
MEHTQEYEPSNTYTKGFNEGYTIAKYMPDVAENLSDILGDSERAKGFQLGRQEYLIEMDKDKSLDIDLYPDWLKDDYTINKDDLEKDRDKEDYELGY